MSISQAMLFASGQVTDPNFSSVSLLLHCDGSNGSTTYIDNSNNAFTLTATATQNTSTFKFGTASAYFSDSYIDTPSNTALSMGTGEFTWEGWFRIAGAPTGGSYGAFIDSRYGGGTGWFWGITDTYVPVLYDLSIEGSALSLDTWYHIALTRDSSNNVRLFVDGTQVGSTGNSNTNLTSNSMEIGWGNNGDNAFNGYIDDLRVTKGVCRYAANFTPPTQAFPNS